MSLFNLNDKVYAVTGASGALAGAAARYLAQSGARVAFISRNQSKLDAAVKGLGPEVATFPMRCHRPQGTQNYPCSHT